MRGGNKRFEFIRGSIKKEEVLRYGKSFGDAYLIYEALEKSNLLKDADIFYKITGRIFLLNSEAIYKTCYSHGNEFIVYDGMGWCLTNIFKAYKDDYRSVMMDVWKDCDESSVNDIEICFYKRLKASGLHLESFSAYPYFEGKQGATLQNYSGGKIERFIRNTMAKLHCFYMGSKMQVLMNGYMTVKGIKGYK